MIKHEGLESDQDHRGDRRHTKQIPTSPLSALSPRSHIYLRQVALRPDDVDRPPSMRTTSNRRRSTEHLTITADPRVVKLCPVWPSAINPHPFTPDANTLRSGGIRLVGRQTTDWSANAQPFVLPNQYILTVQARQ
jgi:hypothetical protein